MSQYYSSSRYQSNRRLSHQKESRFWTKFAIVFLLMLLIISSLMYLWPVSKVSAQPASFNYEVGQPVNINWPNAKQSALGAVDFGVLAKSDNQQSLPTASTAKIFTALMVTKAKPIKPGESGSEIVFNAEDVALMNDYINKLGSYYPIHDGQVLSEYDALRALLIVSANNVADKLAIWAYGSTDEYITQANQYLKHQGLNNTHISDASGFSPETTSSASDILLASQMLMKDDVLAEIVNTKNTTIAGVEVRNTNGLLGQDGVVGVKTGNTDEAKGCFVIARTIDLAEGGSVVILAVVMGSNTVPEAILSAKELTVQAQSAIKYQTVLKKGSEVSIYKIPWGSVANIVANQDIKAVVWAGEKIDSKVNIESLKLGAKKGTTVGSLQTTIGSRHFSTPLVLSQDITNPPLDWRLLRRYTNRLSETRG